MQTVTLPNIAVKPSIDVSASHGPDLAHHWGEEDATDGNKRDGSCFILCSPEYNAYHQGYNEGLRLRQMLVGDVCAGALDEAAWFDEIVGAAPVAVSVVDQIDAAEEWIGREFSESPYAW